MKERELAVKGERNSKFVYSFLSTSSSSIMKIYLFTIVIFLIGASFGGPFIIQASASDPDDDTFFEYDYYQKVDSCSGAYAGYSEETKGHGRYEVVSWGLDEVIMNASIGWSYKNNEGKRESNSYKVQFSFSLLNRTYTSSNIDLDDPYYTSQPPHNLSQWLWIPPDVQVGDKIPILDEIYTVTDKDKTLWSKFIPRKVIELEVKDTFWRNDDYGDFRYDYKDRLCFEKESGMFFAERYEEWDVGYWEGEWAKFRLIVEIDVTKSSYEVEVDWFTLIFTYTAIILIIIGVPYGIWYIGRRVRWVSNRWNIKDLKEFGSTGGYVEFRRVWKTKDFPHLNNNATDYFEPFLEHWGQKALLAKDRVAVAVSRSYGLVGFALYNREAKIGTILCKNTEITETLRAFIGCKDFFSEVKHYVRPTSSMKRNKPLMQKLRNVQNKAYNIFETHKVYEISSIAPTTYDSDLVRPMTANDLPEVTRLAKKVFRRRAKKWIRACLKSGDLSYVATIDNKIVGFGFACVCGSFGRLHTLGVAKEYRGMGIAKELHCARLEAMRKMGVIKVVDEIADWNLASIRISTLSGFKPIGKMYVETIRTKRIKKNIIRR